jgi:uncharacterized protein
MGFQLSQVLAYVVQCLQNLLINSSGKAAAMDTRKRRSSLRASISAAARRRMLGPGERPLFLADWTDVLFVHFAVDPAVLQPHVPFDLDLFRGRAYVSLVAFIQQNLRPRVGGRLAALLASPLATHEFLNVRTYVRCGRERGIYFLAEWIPNRLAALVGPPMYGLPYRLARMHYRFNGRPEADGEVGADGRCRFHGEVVSLEGRLAWCARTSPAGQAGVACRGLERFLLERYTAFTRRGSTSLRFRVWHEPWRRVRARVALRDVTLLAAAFPWVPSIKPESAHFSAGVRDVWIGPPRRTDAPRAAAVWPGSGGHVTTWSKNVSDLTAAAAARLFGPNKTSTRKPSRHLFGTTKRGV